MVVRGLNVTVRVGRSARGDVVEEPERWYWGKSGEVSVVAMVAVALGEMKAMEREAGSRTVPLTARRDRTCLLSAADPEEQPSVSCLGLDGARTRPDGAAACELLLSARALARRPALGTTSKLTESLHYVVVKDSTLQLCTFIIYGIIQNCTDQAWLKDRVSHFVAQLPVPSTCSSTPECLRDTS